MSNFPASALSTVPSIRILGADDPSALFDGSQMISTDLNMYLEDAALCACSQGLASDLHPSLDPPSELEGLAELSYLTTTNQPYLTGYGHSLPYSIQENTSTDRGLSPTTLGSPIPSPASSFGSSLSPSSLCDSLGLSDIESFLPPSSDAPDGQTFWSSHRSGHQSTESLVSPSSFVPIESFHPPGLSETGPHRVRAKQSPSRHGPVASKAMLEANGRRRRHPAQFECAECGQTFTALFSLKRHLQSHTGERPFACSIPGCTQRFYNSSDCKRHEKSRKRHKDAIA